MKQQIGFVRCFLVCAVFLLCVSAQFALSQRELVIVGTGSTVPNPLYSVWAERYNKISPARQLRYLPIGTSESIGQVTRGVSDFGAGEVLLSDEQRKRAGLVAIPTVLIGIVPIYNLPGVDGELRFSGEVLSQIFLGEIKTWNDSRITALNPQLRLPKLQISVVQRPGGKGSNFVFSDFLSKLSPQFRSRIGRSASPKWPVGTPAERSSDMVDKVKAQPGAIGYVELNYAISAGVRHGLVLNAAGKFVKASRETIAAACVSQLSKIGAEFSTSLTNAPGADSYPITSFTWIYVQRNGQNAPRRTAVINLLKWMLSDGQQLAEQQGYVALPAPLVAKITAKVNLLQ